ncbi:hypothetical protein EDB84DRAFT_312221 [Lactarius hengduanensis]|nr:hypothetical protein EDB84DRAFT_312221 [Lactarius hengduanensis]
MLTTVHHQTRKDIRHTSFRSTKDPTLAILFLAFQSGSLLSSVSPDILFDAVYASFILHQFGTKIVKDRIIQEWTDSLYPVTDGHAATSEGYRQHERRVNHRRPDTMDILMALPYILVPPDMLRAEIRAAKEEAGSRAEMCPGEGGGVDQAG